MGKKKRQKKLAKKLAEEARKPTPGKILRLMLKTFLLVLGMTLLIATGLALGLDFLKSLWAQLLLYGAAYLLLYRWLMREFLPPPLE